jgi:hypothetical protein
MCTPTRPPLPQQQSAAAAVRARPRRRPRPPASAAGAGRVAPAAACWPPAGPPTILCPGTHPIPPAPPAPQRPAPRAGAYRRMHRGCCHCWPGHCTARPATSPPSRGWGGSRGPAAPVRARQRGHATGVQPSLRRRGHTTGWTGISGQAHLAPLLPGGGPPCAPLTWATSSWCCARACAPQRGSCAAAACRKRALRRSGGSCPAVLRSCNQTARNRAGAINHSHISHPSSHTLSWRELGGSSPQQQGRAPVV